MHDGRTSLASDVTAEVRRHLGRQVFEAVVPRSVRLAEAPELRSAHRHLQPELAWCPGVSGRRLRAADREWPASPAPRCATPRRATRRPARIMTGRVPTMALETRRSSGGLGRGLAALIPTVGVRAYRTVRDVPVDVDPAAPRPAATLLRRRRSCSSSPTRSPSSGCCSPSSSPSRRCATRSIAGERRLRAAAMAGLETIPAIVRNANEQEQLEIALVENIQRADLNAVEEARAYPAPHGRLRTDAGARRAAGRSLAARRSPTRCVSLRRRRACSRRSRMARSAPVTPGRWPASTTTPSRRPCWRRS